MNNVDISIDDLIEQKIARALENIPKTDTVATSYGSIDVDDLVAACKRLKKTIPSYNDLLRENKKMEDKFNKAMGLLEYLNENDLLQDEYSYTTLCELRGDKEDED